MPGKLLQHLEFLFLKEDPQTHLRLLMSKWHIIGNPMSQTEEVTCESQSYSVTDPK